ncbi:MAG: pyruvate kinase [Conexivisphaerales archaeon]
MKAYSRGKFLKVPSRKTKIVCTLGPATDSEDMVRSLIIKGADCFRLNFSHGTPEEHGRRISMIRRIAEELERPVAIMQDLPGPKVRVGLLREGVMQLRKGDSVKLVEEDMYSGSEKEIPINMERFSEAVRDGVTISLADGTIRLKVVKKHEDAVECVCIQGGQLVSGKGVNIAELSYSGLTEKDRKLMKFGIDNGVDLVAVSFVRSAQDMVEARREIERIGKEEKPLLVAKIEKKEALKDLTNIIKQSDCVMVARGDLGVENPIENVPMIQKQIINLSLLYAKPTITATQILESMVINPTPTRAEVTDIANAIIDGTDALMLSEETAVGKYPVECVEVLDKVARVTEARMIKKLARFDAVNGDVLSSLTEAAVRISEETSSKVIVSLSDSPEFVCQVTRHKPQAEVIVPTSSQKRMRVLSILWGVIPTYLTGLSNKVDEMASQVAERFELGREQLCVAVGKEAMGEGGLFVFRPRRATLQ